jgi:hypothetical protein
MINMHLLLLTTVLAQKLFLGGQPLSFSILGSNTYSPDSGGGSAPGYILSVGLSKYSWLAVALPTPTSTDLLVFKRSDNFTSGKGYQISV